METPMHPPHHPNPNRADPHHPHHPHCPTVHLNYRYFEAGPHWWFGGGADLTPYYAYDEDCRDWHLAHKAAMDTFHPHYYPAFSHWCDEYFFNHHRNETRGIGGTFYDYQDGAAGLLIKADYARQSEDKTHSALQLTAPARSFDQLFAFQQAMCVAHSHEQLGYFLRTGRRQHQRVGIWEKLVHYRAAEGHQNTSRN